jgi:toxin ParE1/3/4
MLNYDVIITQDAENDLESVGDYIAFELCAPETAVAFIKSIRKELKTSLSRTPKGYRLVTKEPWHSRGVRRMNFKNYAAYYVVVEDEAAVYVQNIIFQKRNLPKMLAEEYPHLGEL